MELRRITYDNVDELLALSVSEEQKSFVASNKDSLVDAYIALSMGSYAEPFGLYDSGRPVGFVMFGYGLLGDDDDPDVADGNYCLWRLMIDKRHQGRGLGNLAMEQVIKYVRSMPLGPAEYCWTSYEPENTVAKALYAKYGFVENGERCGHELVAVMRL